MTQMDRQGRMAEIGSRIKEARIAIGMSQEDFALMMGRSGRHWAWKMEAGQIGLSAEELPRVAEVLGRSVQWLLGGRSEVFEVEDPEVRMFFIQHEWTDFSKDEQDMIRHSLRMAVSYKSARKTQTHEP